MCALFGGLCTSHKKTKKQRASKCLCFALKKHTVPTHRSLVFWANNQFKEGEEDEAEEADRRRKKKKKKQ